MFVWPASTRVFLCLAHTDMHKSIDKLVAPVKEVIGPACLARICLSSETAPKTA